MFKVLASKGTRSSPVGGMALRQGLKLSCSEVFFALFLAEW